MAIDGHDKDPLIDLSDKVEHRGASPPPSATPPSFPVLSRVPQTEVGIDAQNKDSFYAAQQAVAEVMRGLTINNVKPSINGGSYSFDIVLPKPPEPPPISETVHPPVFPPPPPPTPGVDAPIVPDVIPAQPIPMGDVVDGGDPVSRTNADVGFRGINGDAERSPIGEAKFQAQAEKDDPPDSANDPESKSAKLMRDDERTAGESKKEFNQSKAERKELEKNPAVAAAIAGGDTSFFASGFVPVLFTRADGLRKIITYVTEDNSKVVEGAAPGEKEGPLPATNAYYTSQAESTHPWKATPGGGAFIDIAKGHVMGFKPYTDGTYGDPSFFLPFVEIYETYGGGSVEVTNNTGFIYAVCTLDSSVEGQEGAAAGGDIGGRLYRPSGAPTVIFSDAAVAAYDPMDANVHFLIAEVSLGNGVAGVENQFLVHNPSIQLDSVFNIP